MYNGATVNFKNTDEYTFYEAENEHFIKNRYLHCNITNIQNAFPKVAMWFVHIPPVI